MANTPSAKKRVRQILRKTEVNMKDGVKDGYKCIFKRQGKGKDVTVFQPSPICQKSFKCKTETQ